MSHYPYHIFWKEKLPQGICKGIVVDNHMGVTADSVMRYVLDLLEDSNCNHIRIEKKPTNIRSRDMPKFSKQHYKIIAEALKDTSRFCKTETKKEVLTQVIRSLDYAFTLDNPRFNTQAFLDACIAKESNNVE